MVSRPLLDYLALFVAVAFVWFGRGRGSHSDAELHEREKESRGCWVLNHDVQCIVKLVCSETQASPLWRKTPCNFFC